LFGVLWGSVSRHRELLKPEVTDEEVRAIAIATTPSIGFYVVATALALFTPHVAAAGYIVIALLAVLRARGESSTEGHDRRSTLQEK
jgi:hypothetical protein